MTMQITRNNLSDTKVQLVLGADPQLLDVTKQQVLQAAAKNLKLPGFRQGKVPLSLVEKHVDPSTVQQEFLQRALNAMYTQALDDERLRPVGQPQVTVTKFVPYTTVEAEIEVEVIGEIQLADYMKFKLKKETASVPATEVKEVLEQLRTREAERVTVERAAKDGDQVTIDFKGVDAKTQEPIQGADGTGYPLVLGSNTFIPGFEPQLMGMKAGETKEFELTFPKDYGIKALQKRSVQFTVTVHTVQELTKSKLDDSFASKVGPFKTLDELKDDVKKQLTADKQHQVDRAFDEQLLNKVCDESKVVIPESVIEAELDQLDAEERRSLARSGQTWQEHLQSEGLTEEGHRSKNREQAERQIKLALVLSEIAEKEDIQITRDELALRLQLLKGQYQDKAMQAELDKPENHRRIASRMLTEKTIAKLREYAGAA